MTIGIELNPLQTEQRPATAAAFCVAVEELGEAAVADFVSAGR